jgi:hypothetical protein
LTSTLFGQKFSVKYNPNIETEKKIISDTIFWSFTDSLNIEHVDLYPQNSDIIFNNNNNKDSIILGSAYAKIVNDTLNVGISKISFGLQIMVLIRITNNLTCDGEITYWTAMMGQESFLKIKFCNIELNQNKFKKGQNLMGKLNLSYTGIIPEEELEIIDGKINENEVKNIYSEKSGEVIGDFNIIIE